MSEGFSERHFELAINMELLQGSPKHHVLSQVEEMRGGYDIALIPALDAVWLMLGEYGGPEGASEAAGKKLPFAASLFLQYKVPAWLKGTKALESPWNG